MITCVPENSAKSPVVIRTLSFPVARGICILEDTAQKEGTPLMNSTELSEVLDSVCGMRIRSRYTVLPGIIHCYQYSIPYLKGGAKKGSSPRIA